jgi:ABC-type lipoprotein export system ATPase subunit
MISCTRVEKSFPDPTSGGRRCWTLNALTIARGERVLVAGPSGCGKTTLLNLLAGLLPPDAGEILVDGVPVQRLTTAEADLFRGEHLGLIFQSFQLLSVLTVRDNLLLAAHYGRKLTVQEAQARADALLETVGLRDRAHQRPTHLSLGEQQRVAIARALMNRPPLLLADEPTASLDAANAEHVLGLLDTLCAEEGTTLLLVSHDPGVRARIPRVVDATGWMRHDPPVAVLA